MAIRVSKGFPLNVKDKKTGTSKLGQFWCMFLARDEKSSKDAISVFATNPEEAQFFTQAKVGTITEVSKSSRRREDGTWETRITINAHIDGFNETAVRDRDTYRAFAEQVNEAPELTKDDFMDFTKAADFGDDGGLPFN